MSLDVPRQERVRAVTQGTIIACIVVLLHLAACITVYVVSSIEAWPVYRALQLVIPVCLIQFRDRLHPEFRDGSALLL